MYLRLNLDTATGWMIDSAITIYKAYFIFPYYKTHHILMRNNPKKV